MVLGDPESNVQPLLKSDEIIEKFNSVRNECVDGQYPGMSQVIQQSMKDVPSSLQTTKLNTPTSTLHGEEVVTKVMAAVWHEK